MPLLHPSIYITISYLFLQLIDKTRVATVFAPAAAAGARYRVAAPVAAFAPVAGHGVMPLARQVAPPTVLRQVSPPAKRRKIAGPLRLL